MKIYCHDRSSVYKDGGSERWQVLNPKECGFVSVLQDNSIASKRNNTNGLYYGIPLKGERQPISSSDIIFINRYKYIPQ